MTEWGGCTQRCEVSAQLFPIICILLAQRLAGSTGAYPCASLTGSGLPVRAGDAQGMQSYKQIPGMSFMLLTDT